MVGTGAGTPGRALRKSVYVYPWDLARLGVSRVLDELADLGFDSLDVSCNYHSIGAFSPRGDAPSVFFAPQGGVYFTPSGDGSWKLTPPPVPAGMENVWSEVSEKAASRGFRLNAWTIGMFQPWLARKYPSTARVLATGERSDVGVCPSNSDVTGFFSEMVDDLTRQFVVNEVRLEGVGFPPLEYGWVRGRFLTALSESGRWNLNLCFCQSCVDRAQARGIDVKGLRARTLARVVAGIGDDQAEPARIPPRELADQDSDLAEFLRMRESSVSNFVRDVAGAAAQNGTGAWICAPEELCGSTSPPLRSVVGVLSGVMARPPKRRQDELWPTITDLRAEFSRIREMASDAGCNIDISVFALTVDPRIGLTSERAIDYLKELIRSGADEIVLYNFGLLTKGTLAALAGVINGDV